MVHARIQVTSRIIRKERVRNSSILLLLALAPNASAEEFYPALQMSAGIPFLAAIGCSGSVVSSSNLWGERKAFASARHCFSEKLPNYGSDGWRISGGKIDLSQSDTRNHNDLILTGIKELDATTPVLKLAKKLPATGEKATLFGFPSKGIVISLPIQSQVTCELRGPIVTPSRRDFQFKCGGGPGKEALFQLMKCPKVYFVPGYSGGPITNEKGEYIGSLSGFFDTSQADYPDDWKQNSYLIFSPLTEADYDRAPAADKFLPTNSRPRPTEGTQVLVVDPNRKPRRTKLDLCSAGSEEYVDMPPLNLAPLRHDGVVTPEGEFRIPAARAAEEDAPKEESQSAL